MLSSTLAGPDAQIPLLGASEDEFSVFFFRHVCGSLAGAVRSASSVTLSREIQKELKNPSSRDFRVTISLTHGFGPVNEFVVIERDRASGGAQTEPLGGTTHAGGRWGPPEARSPRSREIFLRRLHFLFSLSALL